MSAGSHWNTINATKAASSIANAAILGHAAMATLLVVFYRSAAVQWCENPSKISMYLLEA